MIIPASRLGRSQVRLGLGIAAAVAVVGFCGGLVLFCRRPAGTAPPVATVEPSAVVTAERTAVAGAEAAEAADVPDDDELVRLVDLQMGQYFPNSMARIGSMAETERALHDECVELHRATVAAARRMTPARRRFLLAMVAGRPSDEPEAPVVAARVLAAAGEAALLAGPIERRAARTEFPTADDFARVVEEGRALAHHGPDSMCR